VEKGYFETIVAKHYVVSADGKDDNPDIETLEMISAARPDDGFTIYLTYPAYYIIPYHYPNPVTGKPFPILQSDIGAHAGVPGSTVQEQWARTGRPADGTQPIGEPPKE
jgi:hypothetical protein